MSIKENKNNTVLRIAACMIAVLMAAAVLFLLSKQVGVSNKKELVTPPLFDSPSYVELKDGESLYVNIKAQEDLHLGRFGVLIVNTDKTGKGSIDYELKGSSGDEIWSVSVDEASIDTGEWTYIENPDAHLLTGDQAILRITAKGCEPFFIKTQLYASDRTLPFEERISRSGLWDEKEVLDTGISLGAEKISDNVLRYGDIFYHSVIITVVLTVLVIALILLGKPKVTGFFGNILDLFGKYGNDLFLVVLYVAICFSIYVNGYLESINISADSAGYLREAVNMAAGNGFHYDALAGYPDTWFANWPILYPMLIAVTMKVTGLEVYLASKVLSMALVGILIVILRISYKNEAWFYALCMTDLGLMYLYWYSWSELPFIIFLVLFASFLANIVSDEKPAIRQYVFLGLSVCGAFLTRYFGMFLFGVLALYILIFFIREIRENGGFSIKKLIKGKAASLAYTACISGVICLLYLINNKIQNGMPSGVSRSMWWDDYATLTDDLIKALVAEFFNIFHLEVPGFISGLSMATTAALIILVIIILGYVTVKNVRAFSKESVLIATSVIYYGMFIVIRYFSSMDTFYYRFFAPATFLFLLGFAGIIKNTVGQNAKRAGNIAKVTLVIFFALIACDLAKDHISTNKLPYYDITTMNWDEDYGDIPQKSVFIFSNMDFRSLYYRSDVVEGVIGPDDTMDDLNNRYYGSDYMCILSTDAKAMVEAGIYKPDVSKAITDALAKEGKYCVVPLHFQ